MSRVIEVTNVDSPDSNTDDSNNLEKIYKFLWTFIQVFCMNNVIVLRASKHKVF